MLNARLLGQFEIFIDGQPAIISSRPTQSIFAYLLLHPNLMHRRENLSGRFWADSSESNARSNLRHALWRIRKALGTDENTRLETDDLGVAYHPQPGDQLDVDSFEACPEDEDSIDALLQAVSAYGGELLPGFYDEWVTLERERLQAAFDRRLEKLLDRLLEERRWNEALKWGEHWIASGGTPEPAYRALILAYAGLGNLAGAATQYQRCADVLAKELGIEPSEETRRAFEQVRDSMGAHLQAPMPISTTPVPPTFLDSPGKPVPVFVSRKAEMAKLDGYLNKALESQAQVVFIRGEAGSGKSALLQEFTRRSISSHPELAVGLGICNALYGQGIPYLPFRDVLNMLAGDIEPLYSNGTISRDQAIQSIEYFPFVLQTLVEQGPGLLTGFVSSSNLTKRAAEILPNEKSWKKRIQELAKKEPAPAGEMERSPLFEQYIQVLSNIADQHPLLIILDDLQWMDSGTGRLLFHLIRRLKNTRILIAGAFRNEDILAGREGQRHPLELLLNEFQSSFGDIFIDLDKIRETSGREFIDEFLNTEPNRLDETFRQDLYQRTQGHPLFTIQLLRNLQERGEILQDEQGFWEPSSHLNWEKLPPRVEGVIGERIGRLDQDLQDLLLAASVEGELFTVQVLEQVQGMEEKVILRQLSRELEKRHRLVQELGEKYVGGQRLVRFRFVHTIIQQYLYNQIGAAERSAMHLKIAESLEKVYKEDTDKFAVSLAHHYRKAGEMEKAVKYLLQAGDLARNLYAHPEAIDLYKQALDYFKEMGAVEQTAHTLMKLYLVYHSSFDFQRAQETLEECNALWQRLAERNPKRLLPAAQDPYRLAALKPPNFDPGLCDTIFDLEWINELFCGLVELTDDRSVIPSASKYWDVLDGGRRYIFHLKQDLFWSDGKQVTAEDFEFAWKRVLNPETHALSANLLYDILGARDFHQGEVKDSNNVGITALDPSTLEVRLEKPCGYFPYLLGDPILFAVPKHVIEREGNKWTEPGRIVTNGAFQLEDVDQSSEQAIRFVRNPQYQGDYKGNIEHVRLSIYQNELEMYNAFMAGELDMVEFLIPQMQQEELKRYRELGQLHISTIPFVDAIYFISDRPPFDNPSIRRAFVLGTDRLKLAREIENQLPATGGYIPPDLPGHSPDISLPYDPQEAQRIMAAAGYPQGRGFPPVGLLLNLVGLAKGDDLVFSHLQDMWKKNLGVSIQKCWNKETALEFESREDFHMFFVGWLADYPDPASFIQTNYLIDQTHWHNANFDDLVELGRHTLDQNTRMDLYPQADRILIEEAVILPLFYGHIYELRQPWVHRRAGSSIYNPQWRNITLMPH